MVDAPLTLGSRTISMRQQQQLTVELQQSSDWLLTNQLFISLACTALTLAPSCTAYNILAWTAQKTPFLMVVVQLLLWEHVCLWNRYSATAVVYFHILQSLASNGSTCYSILLVMGALYDTIIGNPRAGYLAIVHLNNSLEEQLIYYPA
jgi:hypothetical protein